MTLEELAEINPEALQADGWDEAFIGYVERAGQPPTACYDKAKIIELSIVLLPQPVFPMAIIIFYPLTLSKL